MASCYGAKQQSTTLKVRRRTCQSAAAMGLLRSYCFTIGGWVSQHAQPRAQALLTTSKALLDGHHTPPDRGSATSFRLSYCIIQGEQEMVEHSSSMGLSPRAHGIATRCLEHPKISLLKALPSALLPAHLVPVAELYETHPIQASQHRLLGSRLLLHHWLHCHLVSDGGTSCGDPGSWRAFWYLRRAMGTYFLHPLQSFRPVLREKIR